MSAHCRASLLTATALVGVSFANPASAQVACYIVAPETLMKFVQSNCGGNGGGGTATPAPAPPPAPSPTPAAAAPATYTASTYDELVTAINAANANAGAGTNTITITGNIALAGLLPAITGGTIVSGNGNTISGANAYRIFFIDAGGAAVSLQNVVLANGLAQGGAGGLGGGGGGLGAGGAVFVNTGAVTATDVSFSANAAKGGNGAALTANGSGGGGGGGLGGAGGGAGNAGAGGGGYSGGGGGGGSQLYNGGPNGGPAGAGGAGPGGAGGAGSTMTTGQAGTNGGAGGAAFTAGSFVYGGGGGGGGINGGAGGARQGGGGGGAGYTGAGGTGGSNNGGGTNGGVGAGGGGSAGAGAGGNGGDFGGGGGGYYAYNAGSGGFGGGGAGGYGYNSMGNAGSGGFGGGGGAGGGAIAGVGGTGAGAGSSNLGGGGAGLGGAVFVRDGGSFAIGGSTSVAGGAATGGLRGAAASGAGMGGALFLQGAQTLTVTVGAGQTTTLANAIADDSAASLPGGAYAAGTGAGASLTKTGAGLLVLTGTNTLGGRTTVAAGDLSLGGTGSARDVYVTGGALTLASTTAVSGTIHAIDPTINYASTGTYAAPVSLEVANGSQAADPTILANTSGGAVTLSGAITEGAGSTNQYVTFQGGAGSTTTLTNAANAWTGVTSVAAGATLVGTSATISGGSIVDNGAVTYAQTNSGTVGKAISGSGVVRVSNLTAGNALTFTGALTNAGGLTAGSGGNVTIGATGSVSNGSTTGAVYVTGAGSVVSIAAGGSIASTQSTNGDYASGVYGTGANFVVNNAGTISAPGYLNATYGSNGIYAANGAVVNNTGKIYGIPNGSTATYRSNGVITFGDSVVNNTGATYAAGTTYANGSLTGPTSGGGTILGGWDGVYVTGNGAVYNSGTIAGNVYQGVAIQGAGSVANYAGGRIVGVGSGVQIDGGGSITNNGLIVAGTYNSGADTITAGGSGSGAVLSNGGTITNQTSGIINGGTNGIATNGGATITNAGLVVGRSTGITSTAVVTITNSGTIGVGTVAGNSYAASNAFGYGLNLSAGGVVTNQAGGLISGYYGIANTNVSALQIVNAGTITGRSDYGIYSGASPVGSITNSSVTNSGTISAAIGSAIYLYNGGIVTNSGTLTGGTDAGAGFAVALGGPINQLDSTGTINGGGAGAISLGTFGTTTLNLNAGSTTTGAVKISYGTATERVGGTVNGAFTLTGNTGSGIAGSDNFGILTGGVINGGTTAITTDRGLVFTNSGSITGSSYAIDAGTSATAATVSLLAGSTTSGAIRLGSGNDTVLLYNGQGTGNGGTLTAASFGAIDLGAGTNTLLLRGPGTGTAATGAAGTLAVGSLANVTSLIKQEAGTWVLTGTANSAGTTAITGGTLVERNTGAALGTGAVQISAGAVLQFDTTGGSHAIGSGSFTGAGTIRFTSTDPNAGFTLGNAGNVTFSLASGGLIDVVSGLVAGSASNQGFWTGNKGDLSIASGATFDGVEGNIIVDALNGAGTLRGGYAGGGSTTIGVDNGSGTFTGAITDGSSALTLTKTGTGTQTLGGINTYTGATIIAGGTLALSGAGSIANSALVTNNAVFDIAGHTGNVGVVNLVGTTAGAEVRLGANTLSIADGQGSYAGRITGTGGLTVNGTGTYLLTGANTYSGMTTIGAGETLQGSTASLSSSSTIVDNGVLAFVQGGAGGTFMPGILGAGAVTVSGTGANTLTLAGALTQTGGFTIADASNVTLTGSYGNGAYNASIVAGAGIFTNQGAILVTGGVGGTNGVYLIPGSTLVNAAGASLIATDSAVIVNAGSPTGPVTISNAGLLQGVNFEGVTVRSGNLVLTNAATGVIHAQGASEYYAWAIGNDQTNGGSLTVTNTGGQIVGVGFGIFGTDAGDSVTNSGTIAAGSYSGAIGASAIAVGGIAAVNLAQGGTVSNSGTIEGAIGVTAYGGVGQNFSVTNTSGGLIHATADTAVYQGGQGALTVSNSAGGTIVASGRDAVHNDGFGLTTIVNDGVIVGNYSGLSVNGAIDITNTGLIGAGTLANDTTGAFTANGLYVGIGTSSGGTVVNSGTIQGGSGDGGVTSDGRAGILSTNGALTVTNTGTIATAATGPHDGITALNGALTLTNTGVRDGMGVLTGGIISAANASGVALTGAGSSIVNSGSITGGGDADYGYGVQIAGGGGTITNLAGGTISGGTGSFLLASDDAVTLDLRDQSTTTGQILSNGMGGRTVLIGGMLAGDYNGAAGTGVVNWTLGASGSMQAATFGSADDSFVFNGGTIGGVIDAGAGTDGFTSDIGMGNSAVLNLSTLLNFENLTQASGDLTVTGTGTTAVQLNAGTFTVDGALTAPISAASGTAITVAANGSIVTTNAAAIYTPGGAGTLSIVNAGTIRSSGSDTFVNQGAITLLNTGTISTDLFQAASGGANSAYTNGYTGQLLGGTDAVYGIGANVGDNGTIANYGVIGGGATLANGYASLFGGTNARADLFAGSTTGTVALGAGSTLAVYNGTGTSFAGVAVNGVQLQQAGTNAGAIIGAISLGAGSTLELRGTGDDTAANGVAGRFDIASLANVATLTKADTGTWTLTGTDAPSLTTINAGTGGVPGSGGLLVFDGTSGLTATILVSGGVIRAASDGAFGSGTITTIDPTIQYGATGTFANAIVLSSGDTINDPTRIQADDGVTATLTGAITETNGPQPLVFELTGGAGAGTVVLANAGNLWTGATAIGTGLTLRGTTATISGGAIVDDGVLAYVQDTDGTVAQAISGAGSLIKDGAGTVTLAQHNSYAGGTSVLAGTLAVATVPGSYAADALGTGMVAISSGATLRYDNPYTSQDPGPSGAQIYTSQNVFTGAGNLVFTGGTGALTVIDRVGGSANVAMAAGGVIDVQGGAVLARGNDVFTGNQASLNIASGAAFDGATPVLTVDGLTGGGSYVGTGTLTVGVAGGSATFDGTIGDEGGGGVTALTKTGAGTQTLTGINSYTGLTTIDGGTLALGGGQAIADANSVMVGANGTLALLASERIASLGGTGAVSLGANTLFLGTNDASSSFAGIASGTGGITKTGAGTLTLSGANAYTGLTALYGGTLVLGASDVLADGSTLLGDTGTTIDIGANSDTVAGLILNGTLTGTSGTLTSGYYALTDATVDAMTGAGSLYTTTSNTNTVLNRSAGAGLVEVGGGTLTLGASDLLADTASVYVDTGSTLALGANSDTVGSLVMQAGTLDGTGTLTAASYALFGATVNANLGAGTLSISRDPFSGASVSTLNGTAGAGTVRVNPNATLVLGANDRLADDADVFVATDGVLDLGAFSDTVGNLGLGGTLAGTGTLTAASYALNGATVNANLGAGTLVNTGGVSVLNGTAGAATVEVAAGTLRLGAAERLADSATLLIDATGTLDLGAFQETVGLAAIGGTLDGTGTLIAGQYQLNGATVNANLGAGTLFQLSGTSVLNGTAGASRVAINAGTLALGANDRLADDADVMVASGAVLDLGAFSDTVGNVGLGGTLAGTGTLTAASYALNGATVNANLGAGTLVNTGGVSVLNGTAGAGTVEVAAGTLRLGAAERLADSATLLVDANGTLDLGAFQETVGLAAIGGTLDGTGTLIAGQYQLNGATVNANLGAGTLFQLGGVSTLNGTAGATSVAVNAGTLALGANDRLADDAHVMVASGAVLDLGAFSDTVDTVGLGGTLAGSGTLTAASYALNGATVNANLGAGTLVNTGGVSVLNGTAGAGTVEIAAGTLRLGAAERLADSATLLVDAAGVLDLGAFQETVGLAAIGGTLDGTGTLVAGQYQLTGATVNANLGAGTLFQLGGTSVLNGTAGATRVAVNAGTLALGANDRLANGATVAVASGATLDLGRYSDTVGVAQLSGTLAGTGTLTADQYQLRGATVNANLGAGTLFQLAGVSALNGTAGSALVRVDAGTLALGESERLADNATVVVAAGATLNLGPLAVRAAGTGTPAGTATPAGTTDAAALATAGRPQMAQSGTDMAVVGLDAGTLAVAAAQPAAVAGDMLALATTRQADAGALAVGAVDETVGTLVLNGTLAGTGTLTAGQYQLTGATVNANLGAGTLFQLGGTSVLTGTAGAGIVAINAGTLRLGAAERLANGASVAVAGGATFDLAGYAETVGTLTGTGTVALGAGTLSVGGTNADFGFGGTVSGAGDLTKTGTGTFTLVGAQSMTGRLNANAGTLLFAGTSAGGARIQGGTLAGGGSFAGNLALASGTLSPGSATQPIASFQVGSLSATGGSYAIDVAGTTGGFGADLLRVTGAATLAGTIVAPRALEATANYRMMQLYTVLQAGTLSGTFANGSAFAPVGNNADLYYRLRYDLMPNAVLLELRKQIDFTAGLGADASPNQRSVGAGLNGSALTASDSWAATLNAISALSVGQRQATFDSIGGESLADVTTEVALAGNRFTDLLRTRLAGGNGGVDNGDVGTLARMIDGTAQPGAIRAAQPLGGSASAAADGGNHAGAWLQGFGADGTIQGRRGTATVGNYGAGVAGGFDAQVGAVTFGLAGAITDMEANVRARSARNTGTLYQGGGYVAYDDGATYANAIGSYFAGTVDTTRSVSIGTVLIGKARGEADTTGYTAGGTLGHRFDLGNGLRFTPQVAGQLVHVTRDAFTETGIGGLGLAASRATRDLYTASVQGRLSHRTATPGGIVEPYVTGGVQRTFGDRDTLSALRFTGAPTTIGAFTIEGARIAKTAALLGGGIDAHPNDRVTIGAGVDSTIANRQKDARVAMHVRIAF